MAKSSQNSIVIVDVRGDTFDKKDWKYVRLEVPPGPLVADKRRSMVYATAPVANEILAIDVKQAKNSGRAFTPKPTALTLDADQKYIYVPSDRESILSVIDQYTFKVIKEIPLNHLSSWVTVEPVTGAILVTHCQDPGLLTTISRRNGEFIKREVECDAFPFAVAANRNQSKYYISHYESGTVSIFKTSDHGRLRSLATGNRPVSIAVDDRTSELYVANAGSSSVSVINGSLDHVDRTISVGSEPIGVAVDSGTKRLYVACRGNKTFYMYDLRTYNEIDRFEWK